MVTPDTLGGKFIAWAHREPSIRALVLIGSQSRPAADAAPADRFSDWDFQVVSSCPALFAERTWTRAAGLPDPIVHAARLGRLKRTGKVTAVFPDGDLDLVLLPARSLGLAKAAFQLGLGGWLARRQPALGDLALVLGFGLRVVKGGAGWEDFFRRVVAEVPPTHVDDREVVALAEGFAADYLSTWQKIERGEWLAAQRWLHVQLAETNFRLMHEWKRRRGGARASYPDARRVEKLYDAAEQAAVAVRATLDRESLARAVEHSAQTCREIVAALVGGAWRWPEGLALRLSRE
ncbi:MAG: aminoglycoside 6-adenylyltransferase [Opitutaceae bacterium]|nr:aminoglycoside 6-adenylyltransferase [Opitutaceae bacterium]